MTESMPSNEEILAEIGALARRHLDLSGQIEPATRLVEDLELDSVRLLTLAIEIEDHFRICLDPEDEQGMVTVTDLVEAVASKLRSRHGERD